VDRQTLDRPDSRIPTEQFVAILRGLGRADSEQLTAPGPLVLHPACVQAGMLSAAWRHARKPLPPPLIATF
jgi:hypothetical protein